MQISTCWSSFYDIKWCLHRVTMKIQILVSHKKNILECFACLCWFFYEMFTFLSTRDGWRITLLHHITYINYLFILQKVDVCFNQVNVNCTSTFKSTNIFTGVIFNLGYLLQLVFGHHSCLQDCSENLFEISYYFCNSALCH